MKKVLSIILVGLVLTLTGCTLPGQKPIKNPVSDNVACTMEAKICPDGSAVGRSGPNCEFAACPEAPTGGAQIANPASVNCKEKGGTSEIITAADGSQSSICKFPDGTKCEEWALFRNECQPGTVSIKENPVAANKNSTNIISCNNNDCFLQAAKTCTPAKGIIAYNNLLVLNLVMSGKTETEIKKGANGMCVYYQKYLEASVKYSDKLVQLLLGQGKTMTEIKKMEADGNQSQQMTVGKDVTCIMTIDNLIKKIKDSDIASGNYTISTDHTGCTGTLYGNQ